MMDSCVADGPHSRSVQPGEQSRQTSGLRNSLPLPLFSAGVVLSDWALGTFAGFHHKDRYPFQQRILNLAWV